MGKSTAASSVSALPEDVEQLKEHLAGLTSAQLEELETSLITEFDELYGEDKGASLTAEQFARLSTLGEQITSVQTAKADLDAAAQAQSSQATALHAQIHGASGDDENSDGGDGDEGDGTDGGDAGEDGDAGEPIEGKVLEAVGAGVQDADAFANAIVRGVSAAVEKLVPAESLVASGRDLNRHIRLSAVAQHAPDARVPEARTEAVLTASADIPGFTQGGKINGMISLANAMHGRARSLPISRNGKGTRVPIASLQRDFRFTLDKNSTPEDINEILKAATDVETLVAAGGWCAPSEISYDFFNVVAEDGLIDLPSIGVMNRGGIQIPTSPSFGDIVAADPSGLWTWTETDDIAAVTGSPVKECVRVECPDFVEYRLDCDGLCLTVGNLVDFAYPELVANTIRLLFAARAHLTNARIIQILATNSTAVDLNISPFTVYGSTASILAAVELQAVSYRAKYRMLEGAVLEAVFPQWVKSSIRADLSNRNGVALLDVTDGMIADWFNLRNVRAQFVSDWQLSTMGAATAPTAFPTTVQFMLYAPGTFVRGSGLSLDLGVVRDSVLNETNDHTAAWMEDCYLVAKPGHESRLVTVPLCEGGATGANEIVCA